MKKSEYSLHKILVIRTDRIGDVVLSLPVVVSLRKRYADARIFMLVQPEVRDILDNHQDLDGVILDNDNHRLSGFFRLAASLRRERFDAAVLLHPTLRLAAAMFMARIPIRIGTGYRLYSFLLNRRVFEHRKHSIRHEAEYNLSLAAALQGKIKPVQFHLPVSKKAGEKILKMIRESGITKNYVVIHPGSRGSALDWPAERFFQLGELISKHLKYPVIVTGSKGEQEALKVLVRKYESSVISFVGALTLKELVALLASAGLVIASSTGPLHLAAAAGTTVLGFYPPFRAANVRRWGPFGQTENVLVPPVSDCARCKGSKCEHWNCMSMIQVEEAYRIVQKQLAVGNKDV